MFYFNCNHTFKIPEVTLMQASIFLCTSWYFGSVFGAPLGPLQVHLSSVELCSSGIPEHAWPSMKLSPRVGPWGARYLTRLYDVCKQLKVSLLQLKESCMNEEYFLPLVCISPFVLFGTCHCLYGYWWCLSSWLRCNSHFMKIELWG